MSETQHDTLRGLRYAFRVVQEPVQGRMAAFNVRRCLDPLVILELVLPDLDLEEVL